MDLGPLTKVLSSLAQIGPYHFVVSNGNSELFQTCMDGSETNNSEELASISSQVMGLASFKQTLLRDNGVAYGVPIKNGEAVVGSLLAYTSETNGKHEGPHTREMNLPSPEEIESLLSNLAEMIEERWAVLEDTDKVTEELMQSFEDLTLYSRIATEIKSLRLSNNMLTNLVKELLESMRTDLAFAMFTEQKAYNTLIYNQKLNSEYLDPEDFVELLISSIPKNTSSLKDEYFIVNDSTEDPVYSGFWPEPYRFMALNMRHGKQSYGWIGLLSFNLKEIFRRSELSLMTSLAEQIAVVMSNTDLYRDLESFVINVVKSLVNAIEAKDVYTRGHSERVNRYSMLIGERLHFDETGANALYWASILHDVGKIAIPESILTKPDELTEEEYKTIQSHPKKGSDILAPLDKLSASLPAILHHHERVDGEGYPDGLKGTAIPLMARIIAIADTFDAITSTRPYRSARSETEALDKIDTVSGTQLDPDLVKLFKKILEEKEIISHQPISVLPSPAMNLA